MGGWWGEWWGQAVGRLFGLAHRRRTAWSDECACLPAASLSNLAHLHLNRWHSFSVCRRACVGAEAEPDEQVALARPRLLPHPLLVLLHVLHHHVSFPPGPNLIGVFWCGSGWARVGWFYFFVVVFFLAMGVSEWIKELRGLGLSLFLWGILFVAVTQVPTRERSHVAGDGGDGQRVVEG